MGHNTLKSTLALGILAALCVGASGCNSLPRLRVKGPYEWSGLGASVTLPKGEWEIESLAEEKHAVVFHQRGGPGAITLMRVSAFEKESVWLSLQKLFVAFGDKHPLGRWTRKTPQGDTIYCMAFLLRVDNRSIHATACAVRRDMQTYELIAWGFKDGHTGSRRMAETVADTIRFPEPARKE